MKFYKFQFYSDWSWFVVIPTIITCKNEQLYAKENFRLSLHWLGFHISWQWIKGEEE